MSSNRERNDRRKGHFKAAKSGGGGRPKDGPAQAGVHAPARRDGEREAGSGRSRIDPDQFVWGWHPVLAALANPARQGRGRLLIAESRLADLGPERLNGHVPEVMETNALSRLLPSGAVHQGVAFKVAPLDGVALDDLADPAEGVIVLLDQLTDPQNVGAVFRTALAFGARGIVMQDRHSPALAGPLAKAAAGATERLPHARVTNLSRALERLSDLGWRAVALDGEATETLEAALDDQPTVLVMGAEGPGVRRLVMEHCDTTARIPMPGGFESLNVSNAAAVALYEVARKQNRL